MNKNLALIIALPFLLTACDYMPAWMGGKKPEIVRLPGERVTLLPAEAELRADDSVKGVPVNVPPPVVNGSWPQHNGVFTPANAHLGLAGDLTHSDSVTIGDGNDFEHTLVPRPVVAGGAVYAMDGIGKISAHQADNIEQVLWVAKGVSEEDEPDILGGGLAWANDVLYAVSGRGLIAAIDAKTGAEKWRRVLRIPLRSAPHVDEGKVFLTSIDNQIFALNAANGEVLWSERGINEVAELMNSVSPTSIGGVVIAPFSSGELYAYGAADGHEIWSETLALNARTKATALFSGIGGDPVVDREVVFAVSSGGKLAAYGIATGQHLWERPLSSINTPWLAGDYLYVLSANNTLICFVKYDGRIRWTRELPSFGDPDNKRRPISWKGPVLAGGKLAVVGSRGEMQLFSPIDGHLLATQDIASDIYTAPVVAGGRMYLIGQNAKLYVLQ